MEKCVCGFVVTAKSDKTVGDHRFSVSCSKNSFISYCIAVG